MLTQVLDPQSYFLNPHAVPTVLASLALLGLAVAVLVRERASRVSRLFAAACATILAWLAAFSVMYCATTPEVGQW
jgi:hypothetical protein